MELSTPLRSSLATPAAMALVSPNPKITKHICARGMRLQCQFSHKLRSVAPSMVLNKQPSQRINRKDCGSLKAASPVQFTENLMQSSISFKDFCVSVCAKEDGLIKIQVNVSGTMTDSIFEEVFTKKVAAAQPLPGFRRMKGGCYLNHSGKTPDIPKEVALHLIGPSKVKKETIKKIINCSIVEYVQKEGLTASKNLKVHQSYEELEAAFEPGKEFCFDATVHLQ
ncbi:uncharacterized protein LOC112883325 isoform X1 [Panicum hallii]|uniref:uncharacterized protein LOC112883325 isoform X1 n=1 Tax=Panicum hallii TaxID=206008 RepID=UPI000DF4DE92|nr:uncharacterized protein LOC112883325 isoform X1 [Panicum hallii]